MIKLFLIEKLMKSLITLDEESYPHSTLFKGAIATGVDNIGSEISEKIFSKREKILVGVFTEFGHFLLS